MPDISNIRRRSSGHLWQARYHSVAMEPVHCWRALAYVERNPVRAGIVPAATSYPWSSAAARMGLVSPPPWLDMHEWRRNWTDLEWQTQLDDRSGDERTRVELREATLSGLPLGQALIERLEVELGRTLRRGKAGRPAKRAGNSDERSFHVGSA